MPEIPCEIIRVPCPNTGGAQDVLLVARWAGITLGDTCKEFAEAGLYPDKTVHAFGVWGGATLAIQGRGDLEADPITLRADPSGVLL